MSKLVRLVLALALLALSLPAFSAPLSVYPLCWNVDGTPCRTAGQTESCTDDIYLYTCTCTHYPLTNKTLWACPPLK
jgi:hypothetical protein